MFDRLRRAYARLLDGSLNYQPVTATFAAAVLGGIFFLYSATSSELARRRTRESSSRFHLCAQRHDRTATDLLAQVYLIGAGHKETDHVFQLDVPGQSIAGYVLKPGTSAQ